MCEKFYIGFQSSDNPRWWMAFLSEGYHHCWIAKALPVQGDEFLLMSEDMYGYAATDLVYDSIDDVQRVLGATIIEIELDVDPLTPYVLEPISCVTWVKKQLGIAKRTIQTPKQLYKYLLSIGGKLYGRNG